MFLGGVKILACGLWIAAMILEAFPGDPAYNGMPIAVSSELNDIAGTNPFPACAVFKFYHSLLPFPLPQKHRGHHPMPNVGSVTTPNTTPAMKRRKAKRLQHPIEGGGFRASVRPPTSARAWRCREPLSLIPHFTRRQQPSVDDLPYITAATEPQQVWLLGFQIAAELEGVVAGRKPIRR